MIQLGVFLIKAVLFLVMVSVLIVDATTNPTERPTASPVLNQPTADYRKSSSSSSSSNSSLAMKYIILISALGGLCGCILLACCCMLGMKSARRKIPASAGADKKKKHRTGPKKVERKTYSGGFQEDEDVILGRKIYAEDLEQGFDFGVFSKYAVLDLELNTDLGQEPLSETGRSEEMDSAEPVENNNLFEDGVNYHDSTSKIAILSSPSFAETYAKPFGEEDQVLMHQSSIIDDSSSIDPNNSSSVITPAKIQNAYEGHNPLRSGGGGTAYDNPLRSAGSGNKRPSLVLGTASKPNIPCYSFQERTRSNDSLLGDNSTRAPSPASTDQQQEQASQSQEQQRAAATTAAIVGHSKGTTANPLANRRMSTAAGRGGARQSLVQLRQSMKSASNDSMQNDSSPATTTTAGGGGSPDISRTPSMEVVVFKREGDAPIVTGLDWVVNKSKSSDEGEVVASKSKRLALNNGFIVDLNRTGSFEEEVARNKTDDDMGISEIAGEETMKGSVVFKEGGKEKITNEDEKLTSRAAATQEPSGNETKVQTKKESVEKEEEEEDTHKTDVVRSERNPLRAGAGGAATFKRQESFLTPEDKKRVNIGVNPSGANPLLFSRGISSKNIAGSPGSPRSAVATPGRRASTPATPASVIPYNDAASIRAADDTANPTLVKQKSAYQLLLEAKKTPIKKESNDAIIKDVPFQTAPVVTTVSETADLDPTVNIAASISTPGIAPVRESVSVITVTSNPPFSPEFGREEDRATEKLILSLPSSPVVVKEMSPREISPRADNDDESISFNLSRSHSDDKSVGVGGGAVRDLTAELLVKHSEKKGMRRLSSEYSTKSGSSTKSLALSVDSYDSDAASSVFGGISIASRGSRASRNSRGGRAKGELADPIELRMPGSHYSTTGSVSAMDKHLAELAMKSDFRHSNSYDDDSDSITLGSAQGLTYKSALSLGNNGNVSPSAKKKVTTISDLNPTTTTTTSSIEVKIEPSPTKRFSFKSSINSDSGHSSEATIVSSGNSDSINGGTNYSPKPTERRTSLSKSGSGGELAPQSEPSTASLQQASPSTSTPTATAAVTGNKEKEKDKVLLPDKSPSAKTFAERRASFMNPTTSSTVKNASAAPNNSRASVPLAAAKSAPTSAETTAATVSNSNVTIAASSTSAASIVSSSDGTGGGSSKVFVTSAPNRVSFAERRASFLTNKSSTPSASTGSHSPSSRSSLSSSSSSSVVGDSSKLTASVAERRASLMSKTSPVLSTNKSSSPRNTSPQPATEISSASVSSPGPVAAAVATTTNASIDTKPATTKPLTAIQQKQAALFAASAQSKAHDDKTGLYKPTIFAARGPAISSSTTTAAPNVIATRTEIGTENMLLSRPTSTSTKSRRAPQKKTFVADSGDPSISSSSSSSDMPVLDPEKLAAFMSEMGEDSNKASPTTTAVPPVSSATASPRASLPSTVAQNKPATAGKSISNGIPVVAATTAAAGGGGGVTGTASSGGGGSQTPQDRQASIMASALKCKQAKENSAARAAEERRAKKASLTSAFEQHSSVDTAADKKPAVAGTTGASPSASSIASRRAMFNASGSGGSSIPNPIRNSISVSNPSTFAGGVSSGAKASQADSTAASTSSSALSYVAAKKLEKQVNSTNTAKEALSYVQSKRNSTGSSVPSVMADERS